MEKPKSTIIVEGKKRVNPEYLKWRYRNEPDYKEKILKLSREYYKKHKQEKNRKSKINKRRRLLRLKKLVFEKLGNKCSNPYNLPHYPWNSHFQILQLDYINDDGRKDPLRKTDYSQYYKDILKHLLLSKKSR